MNDGVIFYKSHFDNIKDLSDSELGQIFRACMTGETGAMSMHVKMAYTFLSSQIKRDSDKYVEIIEKRRAAGRMGGAPKGNKNAQKSINQEDGENKQNKQKVEKTSKTSKTSNNININSNINNNINNNINSNINSNNDTSNDVSNNKEIVSVTTSSSVDALREKSSWIENVAMNYGLTTQGVQSWMDRFESEVINCKLKTHANQKDLASHFCDWLRIKLAEQRPQSRMQSTNDKMTAYIQSLSN
jgi:hypothetical protein